MGKLSTPTQRTDEQMAVSEFESKDGPHAIADLADSEDVSEILICTAARF